MEVSEESQLGQSGSICPVCSGAEFGSYRGRPRSSCATCGSKERHRFMALVLRSSLVPKEGVLPVYHFAPERSIADVSLELFGAQYTPADLVPKRYSWSKIPLREVDLTRPLAYFEPESAGGFIHSHVLEHIPAPIDRVIREMNRALAPGGFHVFQVPIHKGWYREDMNPDLDPDERTRLFHQADHMRQFGDRDFEERVLDLFSGMVRLDISAVVDERVLTRSAVPASALTRYTGHSVFLYQKP